MLITEKNGYILKVKAGGYPADNPRYTYDNLGTIVTKHKRYAIGEKEAINTEKYNNWVEWLEGELVPAMGEVICLPIYLYDHSMVSISTESFVGRTVHARWDSGQIGWIYTTKKKAISEYPEENYEQVELLVKEVLEKEVEIYDKWQRVTPLSISIYDVTHCEICDHTNEQLIFSQGGFYNIEEIEQELSDGLAEEVGFYGEMAGDFDWKETGEV